jgi:hypothetical protein
MNVLLVKLKILLRRIAFAKIPDSSCNDEIIHQNISNYEKEIGFNPDDFGIEQAIVLVPEFEQRKRMLNHLRSVFNKKHQKAPLSA